MLLINGGVVCWGRGKLMGRGMLLINGCVVCC